MVSAAFLHVVTDKAGVVFSTVCASFYLYRYKSNCSPRDQIAAGAASFKHHRGIELNLLLLTYRHNYNLEELYCLLVMLLKTFEWQLMLLLSCE